MKQKIILAIIIVLILIVGLIIVIKDPKENEELFKNNESDFISIMLQDEDGNYEQSNITEFNPEGYHYNSHLSKCVNGSTLKYEDGSIYVKGNTSDRCYAYYDNNNFVEDLSGNGNHGKGINIANWNEDGITTSNLNTSGYIDCGLDNYDFHENISMIIRFRQDTNTNGSLFSNTEYSGIAIHYWIGRSISVHIYTEEKDIYLISDIPKVDNQWYTIVVTYDGQKIIMYNDGEKVVEQNLTGNIKQSIYPLLLGADPGPSGASSFTNMTISETLIFKRALTAEEIAKDYANEINPTNKDNLLLWYKFN